MKSERRHARTPGHLDHALPALPGCYTQGETLEEIQANLREAAEGWLVSAHDEAMDRHSAEEGAA